MNDNQNQTGDEPGDSAKSGNPESQHPPAPAESARSTSPTIATTGTNPARRPLRLSEEIDGLIKGFAERAVTLQEVLNVLHGRAYTLLLIFLALPFCTPVPLPGVSTPFGLVIAIIGFRLALRQKPWLPRRLLNTKVPPRFFARLLGAARRLIRSMEFFLRPRWSYLLDAKLPHHAYGAIICVCGLLLLLPLPIPLSNGLPALTIVLIACSMLERDGYFLVAGLIMFAFTLCFFGALYWGGAELVSWLRAHLETFFGRTNSEDL
jgi:hypothetical protein